MTLTARFRPTAALLAAVMAGILLAPFFPFSPALGYVGTVVCLISGFVLHGRYARAAKALFLLAFLFLSAGRARQIMIPAADDVSRWAERPSLWISGSVVSDIDQRERGARAFTLAVSVVNDFRAIRPASGQIRVFLRNGPTPETGDVLTLRGRVETPPEATNPGAFDYRKYLARQGVFSVLHVRQGDDLRRERSAASVFYALVKTMRVSVRRGSANLTPNYTGLMNGLVLSDRDGLNISLSEAFTRTGTVHLLSVSGTHLSALVAFLTLAFSILYAPRPLACAISIAYLWLFVLASGSSPAALRSALMASVVLAGPLVRRAPQMAGSLIFAALALLLFAPGDLFDVGFQFSFAAIGVLCFYALPLSRLLLRRRPDDTALSVAFNRVTMAILSGALFFVGTAPLCAYYFNILSPIGIVANCLLIPLAELLTLLGLASPVALFLPLPFLNLVSMPVNVLIGVFLFITFAFSNLPFAAFSVPSPPLVFVLGYYAFLGILAPFVRRYALQKTLFDPMPVANNSAGGAHAAPAGGLPTGRQ